MAVVLDTRFLLTHTFPPSEDDKKLLKKFTSKIFRRKVYLPLVVVVEYIKIAGKRLGSEGAENRLLSWLASGVHLVEMTYNDAVEAGKILLIHDVPVADAIIASIAKRLKAPVVSDDPHFSELKVKTIWYKDSSTVNSFLVKQLREKILV